MKNLSLNFKTTLTVIASLFLFGSVANGQVEGRKPFPYVIENNTPYPDNQVYVAVVGEDLTSTPGNHVWVDCKTSTMKMMSRADNTIKGPVYVWLGPNGTGPGYDSGLLARNDFEGNRGPFGDAMYANCFTKLSDIPNKTIMLPLIQGCRVFFSMQSPLYLCFRGSNPTPGADSGYTAPAVTDYTDPNINIMWDMIELTYDKYGYFANTSRVDSYNYPMGMESIGKDMQWDSTGKLIVDAQGKAILVDSNKKIGEKKTHDQIQAQWKEFTKAGSGKEEFANCYHASTGAIVAPGKIKDFADGSVGTMPNQGPYVNYYKTYVDKVWSSYSTKDLVFDSGDAGVWTGRVQGETFTFTCDKVWGSAKGIITRKPTTQEVLEGKGCLDQDVQKIAGQQLDRVVQAQICAALNRHLIPVDGEVLPKPTPTITKNGKSGILDFSKSEYFYQAKPSNYYAAFWHQGGINMNDKGYGFCYDDVWNYASGAPSFMPEKVIIHLNGWATVINTLDAIITPANQSFITSTTSAALDASKCTIAADRLAFKTFAWSIMSKPIGSNPTIAAATAAMTTISGLSTGATIVRLIIGDGLKTDTATSTITISNMNPCDVLPIVNAGNAQSLTNKTGLSATLKGTASDPLSGTANRASLNYAWTKIGDNNSILSSPTSLETSVTGLAVGVYEYELTATIASNCITPLVSKSRVKITVSESTIDCGGEVIGTNGSGFGWSVSKDAHPVIKFIPLNNKSTAPIVIHYRVNGGSEGGYNTFSGMNYTINNTSIGDKVEFYYVYTVPAGGEGNSASAWAQFTVGVECKSTALSNIDALASEISIYPNPASTNVQVKIPSGISFSSAQIINTIGNVVQSSTISDEIPNIDISSLPNGIYFIQLIGEKNIVKKFIKKQ